MTDALHEVAATWSPPVLERTVLLDPAPLTELAALLRAPVIAASERSVPPLWHWMHFTHATTESLGEDGHPLAGPHLPPLPARRRMVAGGRFWIDEPLPLGETCTRRSEVTSVEVREGRSGAMLLVTIRHDFIVNGQALAREEEDIVYRVQPPGTTRALAAPREAAVPDASALRVPTDEVTLFRFSALTGNSHRIHYDHPYATGVEGFPGLVVHGPLLALGMLEPARRRATSLSSLSYRFLSPGYCGDDISVAETSGDAEVAAVRRTGHLLATLKLDGAGQRS